MDGMINFGIKAMMMIIGILIGLIVVIGVAVAVWPTLIAQVVSLSSLGNFSFASLFSSSGFVPLLLSVVLLLIVLVLIIGGIVMASKHVGGGSSGGSRKGKR
jgi:hypothetical protein